MANYGGFQQNGYSGGYASYPAYGGYNPAQPRAEIPMSNYSNYNMGVAGPTLPAQSPPISGASMAQPNMTQNIPQPQAIQMNPIQGLSQSSRVVASKEEAAAVPADFGGAPIIMPVLENGKVSAIYVKQWDIQQGQAIFADFYATQPPVSPQMVTNYGNAAQSPAPGYVSIQDFQSLQDIVGDLQKEIDRLKKPKAGKNASTVKENDSNE